MDNRPSIGRIKTSQYLEAYDLKAIINSIDEEKTEEIKKIRNKTIILIGFAGGFRRLELVSLDYEDIDFVPEGLKIIIRRSKTDQFGEGMIKGLPYFINQEYCPVIHLQKWLKLSKIKSGSLFRRFAKGCSLTSHRLTDQSVVLLIKKYLELAGSEDHPVEQIAKFLYQLDYQHR